MSDPDRGNPAPGAPESPVGEVEGRGRAAGAEEAVVHHPGPQGDGDDAAGLAGVAGPMGSVREEARAAGVRAAGVRAAGIRAARVRAGIIFEDDSDIGPADEGEENMEHGPDMAVDAYQFPMVGFRVMFLNLVHTLMHRLYHNNHVLVRPHGIRRRVWPRHQRARHVAQIHVVLVPQASGEGAAAMVPEASGEGALAMALEGSGEGATAPGPEQQAEAQEACAAVQVEEEAKEPVLEAEAPEETTTYQDENSEKEAQDAESMEEKEEMSKKQEGPEKDEESAGSSSAD